MISVAVRAPVVRLQRYEHASAVERRVGAVDADERRQAVTSGSCEDLSRERLLPLGHRREGTDWGASLIER